MASAILSFLYLVAMTTTVHQQFAKTTTTTKMPLLTQVVMSVGHKLNMVVICKQVQRYSSLTLLMMMDDCDMPSYNSPGAFSSGELNIKLRQVINLCLHFSKGKFLSKQRVASLLFELLLL